MGDIAVHLLSKRFSDARKAFYEAKLAGHNAELWLIRDGRGNRYAVLSRVKRRGRNPKIVLLDRLDVDNAGLDGVSLPRKFRIVGRWVDCIALNDRRTLIVRGDGLQLLTD